LDKLSNIVSKDVNALKKT